MVEWMRGPLRDFVAAGIRSLAARQVFPVVDFDFLQHRFDSGHLSWARLWQFVVLGHWLDNNRFLTL